MNAVPALSSLAIALPEANLKADDLVGISFWIISMALGLDGAGMLRAAVLPTLATLVGAGVFLAGADPTALDDELLRLVFIGLAALTAPHMLVVEPVLRRLGRRGRRARSFLHLAETDALLVSLRDDGA